LNRILLSQIKKRLLLLFLLLLASFSAVAQTVELRTVVTYKVATFEQNLKELAQQGFRLEKLYEAPAIMTQGAILTRQAGVTTPRFEYLLLGTKRLETLQKELDAAAAQGYEVIGAMSAMVPYVGTDIILVLERPLGAVTARFNYSLISTAIGKEDKFSESLPKAIEAGFRPVKVLQNFDVSIALFVGVNKSASLIVMARPLASRSEGDNPAVDYQTLETRRISTMAKELKQAAEQGYSFYLSSPGRLVLLSRPKTQVGPKAEYKLLKLRKAEETERELLDQSRQGFLYRASFFGNSGIHLVLEKAQQAKSVDAKPEYKLLKMPVKEKEQEEFQKEVTQALSTGFIVLDLVAFDKLLLVRWPKTP
jgi:hypothetical protein